jgi:alkylresorcinol/alkylpyrone synthase
LPVSRAACITGLATALPDLKTPTDAIWDALGKVRGRRFKGAALSADAPRARHLAAPLDWIMRPHSQSERTEAYLEHARRLAADAASAAIRQARIDQSRIGQVVCVSCTGFVLPSLDAELIPRLGLRPDTARLPIAELGCGGGVSGLARSQDYVRAYPDKANLLVAVELPSLTFQPDDSSVDNLIAAVVFGDGAGAAVIESADGRAGIEIVRTATWLVPEGARDLGYELRDGGLKVILSRRLPEIIRGHLRGAVEHFLAAAGESLADLDVVAAHPGGHRILDAVERSLELAPHQLAASRQVFSNYGNASSAGIFFVLQELREMRRPAQALAIAFGPGLSIELARLTLSG